MPIKTTVLRASGPSLNECVVIVKQHDAEEPRPRYQSGYFVLERRAGATRVLLRTAVPIDACWRSPEGAVYLACDDGVLRSCDAPSADPMAPVRWSERALGWRIDNVWGDGAGALFLAGESSRNSSTLVRLGADGAVQESPVEARDWAVGGAPDGAVVAVGDGGYIARYEDAQWKPMERATTSTLNGVVVLSEDEFYACSPNGELLAGTRWGAVVRVRKAPLLACVSKFAGTVIAGAGSLWGLMKFEGDAMVEVAAAFSGNKWAPLDFDTRGSLLAACGTALVGSTDLVQFDSVSADAFAPLLR